jgi:UDP-N-acetylglucosamine 1-carboxyvinyltransferase
MSKFEIQGPNNLVGEIKVFGAKNVALKLIAATVLIKDKVTLKNMPQILDIQNMLEILEKAGADISQNGHETTIDTTNLSSNDPDGVLMEKLRASVVLIGPYLARFHRINVPRPGGCSIGTRSIDVHLDAFTQLGIDIVHKTDGSGDTCQDNLYHFSCANIYGQNIQLKEASCTATENIMMAAALSSGKTVINNAAQEPQIEDLANFLNSAGAQITGAGSSIIEIVGVETLKGLSYTIMPDPIEAGTFVCLAAITNSEIKITHCKPDHLRPFLDKITDIGINFEVGDDYIVVKPTNELRPTNIDTAVYPGFPTDLQAPIGLVLTQADGESTICENLFENRLGYLNELEKMGAKIKIIDNHTAKIAGPTKLHGSQISSLDLRAGATVLLAGLAATGTTIIENAEMIDRGYEKIEERLSALGAKIKRIA